MQFAKNDRVFCRVIQKDHIKHYGVNATAFDFSSLNKKFDLIFIDGGHAYHEVCSDTINALRILRDRESVIVWHDYLDYAPSSQSMEPREEIIQAIYDCIPHSHHKFIYGVSNTKCAIFIQKEFKSHPRVRTYAIPQRMYEVTVREEIPDYKYDIYYEKKAE